VNWVFSSKSQARQKGNIVASRARRPRPIPLVLSDYIKQGDNMTLVMDKQQKILSA
jgi:hypothetical protein